MRKASLALLAVLVGVACTTPTTDTTLELFNVQKAAANYGRLYASQKVTDVADYKSGTNGLPSTGIPYVLVNGTVMVRDSEVVSGVFPGQSIRYPADEKGRFEPLAKEKYLDGLLVGQELPDLDDEALGQESR